MSGSAAGLPEADKRAVEEYQSATQPIYHTDNHGVVQTNGCWDGGVARGFGGSYRKTMSDRIPNSHLRDSPLMLTHTDNTVCDPHSIPPLTGGRKNKRVERRECGSSSFSLPVDGEGGGGVFPIDGRPDGYPLNLRP